MATKRNETVNITVAVRIRPPLQREIKFKKFRSCIAVNTNQNSFNDNTLFISSVGKPLLVTDNTSLAELASQGINPYQFDKIFDQTTTQKQVFDGVISDCIKSVFSGINSTIFAYGQTGSGKTYTMEGPDVSNDSPELRGIVPQAIYDIFLQLQEENRNKDTDITIFFSALQIYQNKISDLICDWTEANHADTTSNTKYSGIQSFSSERDLAIHQDPTGHIYVEGLSQVMVNTPEEACNLVKRASTLRKTAETRLNKDSSRSHCIITLTIVSHFNSSLTNASSLSEQNYLTSAEDANVCYARLNLVDLSGSERVKQSGASGQNLKEAQFINSSLFTLIRVVDSLTSSQERSKQNKHIPYRDSKLTWLLKDSIGGNCKTVLLAMISPAQTEAHESLSTLRFASSCSRVENRLLVNRISSKLADDMKLTRKSKPKNTKLKFPWEGMKLDDTGGYQILNTKLGRIAALMYGPINAPVVIYLHGCPSDSEEMLYFFPPILYTGYRIVGIDQPGYGRSTGTRFPSRSTNNRDKNGPVDVCLAVMDELKIKSATFIGYDWGAGIAISLALAFPKKVKRVVAFHPSYSEIKTDELKIMKPPVLLLWVKEDLFHSWKSWKILAGKIPTKQVELFDLRCNSSEIYHGDTGLYDVLAHKILPPLVIFLGGPDPRISTQDVVTPLQVDTVTTSGTVVTEIKNITLQNQLSLQQTEKILEKHTPVKDSVMKFIDLIKQSILPDYYYAMLHTNHLNHRNAVQLFTQLPLISFAKLEADPTVLIRLGIWERLPGGWEDMISSPRYFPGRQVLVKVNVCPVVTSTDYLKFQEGSAEFISEKFTTHRARLVSLKNEEFIVGIENTSNSHTEVAMKKKDIFDLNQPHHFGKDDLGWLILEDGLRCNYDNSLVKAKLLEIAYRLTPYINELNFNGDTNKCIQIQKEAIRTIRKSLNIISFAQKLDRSRFGRTDCVGKLAIHGQGQCHGMSSTMAAFIYPFCSILGIDIKYRGGFSFKSELEEHNNSSGRDKSDIVVTNNGEKHQWLELTYRPSMTTYICDAWYDDTNNNTDNRMLYIPVDVAYSKVMYPHGRLLMKNFSQKIQKSDVSIY